jgi:hypothetical protein
MMNERDTTQVLVFWSVSIVTSTTIWASSIVKYRDMLHHGGTHSWRSLRSALKTGIKTGGIAFLSITTPMALAFAYQGWKRH